jgi:hypothetical protein
LGIAELIPYGLEFNHTPSLRLEIGLLDRTLDHLLVLFGKEQIACRITRSIIYWLPWQEVKQYH